MSIMVGPATLMYNGLVSWYPNAMVQTTNNPAFDKMSVLNVYVHFLPDISEDTSEIRDSVDTYFAKQTAIPTEERALIDYLQHLDRFEEGIFARGLVEYVWAHEDKPDGLSKLKALAEKRGVLEQLEDWIARVTDPTIKWH